MLLVISWWGLRAFYAIWVLKAIEELKLEKQIKAIFWVSGGAIVASYRSSWFSAADIFDKFIKMDFKDAYQINWFGGSLLKSKQIQDFFKKDLPNDFRDLKKKLYIWAVDSLQWKFILFDKWELILPLIGSMALPWIFQPVPYWNYLLMDGWLINNFPVEMAKQIYPNEKVIWIALNKLSDIENITNMFQSVTRSFEIVVESSTLQQLDVVDILFYPDLDVQILDIRKSLVEKAYISGYDDWIVKFQNHLW